MWNQKILKKYRIRPGRKCEYIPGRWQLTDAKKKNLPKETLEELDIASQKLEDEATANGVQEKYLALIEELEAKATK